MKTAVNKIGENTFNMRNKPFKMSNNESQWSNKPNENVGFNQKVNKTWQQGKNLLNPAANKPHKFGGNNDAEVVNSMTKKHIDDLNSEEDLETSESDDEVEDQVNEKKAGKIQTSNLSNETSDSEDMVDAGGSKEEVEVGVHGNEMESSSEEEPERENVVEQQKAGLTKETKKSRTFQYITDTKASNERHARTICVSELPLSIKEKHLQQLFSRYGKIEEITINVSSHKKIVSADILFLREEDARKSLEACGMKYKGNYLLMRKRNRRLNNENTYVVYVTWQKNADIGLVLDVLESFGVVNQFNFTKIERTAFVYFESVDSVELALAAGTIGVGSYKVYIKPLTKEAKQRKQSNQHEECHNVRKKRKRAFKQPIQHQQYHRNFEPSIQIHKNRFDDSVTISFNRSGYQESQFGRQKQYKVRTGFMQKRR